MAKAKLETAKLSEVAQDLMALLQVAQQAQAIKRCGLGTGASDSADTIVTYLMAAVAAMAKSVGTQVVIVTNNKE